ncbi:MAG: polysaccharide biosynthesis tyrosine autokinase [Sphingobacteriales bacterium]|nr:polysaccharide biosynthesis tyrosine autokinase [Sphingobacteriales bacterium]
MSVGIENNTYIPNSNSSGTNLSELLFRIIPYWYIIAFFLVIGATGAYLFLKKATPTFEIKAQIVVNDAAQKKSNSVSKENQLPIQPDQPSIIEKQVEIIQSKALMTDVAQKLKLYTVWSYHNKLWSLKPTDQQLFKNVPVTVEFAQPQLITNSISGEVKVLPNQHAIQFNGNTYLLDSFVQSPFGLCKWHLNTSDEKFFRGLTLKVLTIAEAADILKSKFEASTTSKESNIVNLSLADEVPERAELILATIIDDYGKNSVANKKQLLQNSLAFVEERLKMVTGELVDVERTLQSYKSQKGVTDLATESQIYLGQAKDNEQQINDINAQVNVLNQLENYLINQNAGNSPPATLGLSDQGVVNLTNDLFKDEKERERLLKVSGPKNPQIKVLDDQIAQRKAGIMQSVKNLRSSLLTSRETLVSSYGKANSSLRSIPIKEKALGEISRDHSVKNDLYNYLLQKREEITIDLAGISSDYTVINKPENQGRTKPKPVLIYSYAMLIAGLIAGTWVYKKEFANGFILYRSEIERNTNLPILGEFNFDQTVKKDPVVFKHNNRTLVTEQFRELRLNINRKLVDKPVKTLLLTSSVPDEGKSFISLNLATSFAMTGKKTALVEFDLYKPRISARLQIEPTPGIIEFLKGECGIAEICRPYEQAKNLTIVSCGGYDENPAELLRPDKMDEMMQYLRNNYDCIILDTPCIGLISDTKILAYYADISLYILRYGHTNTGFFKYLNQLNAEKSLPELNLVFNGIKIKKVPGFYYWDSYGVNGYRYTAKNTYAYTPPNNRDQQTKK